MQKQTGLTTNARPGKFARFWHGFWQDRYMHLLVLPALIYIIIFCYVPMYGIQVAFKNFAIRKGIWGSPWVGMKNFEAFFNSIYFWRLIRNTVFLSFGSVIFSFPVPIIFALMLNELNSRRLRNLIQTVSYYPHFVSVVIVVGIMRLLLSPETGIINNLIVGMGGETIAFMESARWFRTLYFVSGIWQGFGWSSIIYLAALAGVAPELYEAAQIDGANRFQRVWHVSLPTIMPTIVILLIMALGGVLSVGKDKILLMYNPGIYDVADVISTYVHRKSIEGGQFAFGTAVDLFNNVVNFVLIVIVNYISKKVTEISLW